MNWRNHLPIHPAAELFPLMSEAELKDLAEDIKNHGLQTPIVIWETEKPSRRYRSGAVKTFEEYRELIDGRNRLDALALLGLLSVDDDGELCLNKWWNKHQWIANDRFGNAPLATNELDSGDPYALALSYNVHRRHLTPEQKRELIAKVLKAKPGASNRQIAEQVKADDKTVAKVRTELEATAEIPQLKKTTGKDGKSRPASKPKRPSKAVASDSFPTRASGNDVDTEASAEQRRTANAELESADDGDRKSATEPDKKPNRTNRFANVANARKRAAATEALQTAAKDALIIWIAVLSDTELRQVYEAIGVHQILPGIPEPIRSMVAEWAAKRQVPAPPPVQAEPQGLQDNLSIPDFMRRGVP